MKLFHGFVAYMCMHVVMGFSCRRVSTCFLAVTLHAAILGVVIASALLVMPSLMPLPFHPPAPLIATRRILFL
jgi:hypothetical protein